MKISVGGNMKGRDEERAAECKTLIEDIQNFYEDLPQNERTFIEQTAERLDKYGTNTFISDAQYKWIQTIYERVC